MKKLICLLLALPCSLIILACINESRVTKKVNQAADAAHLITIMNLTNQVPLNFYRTIN
jgi:hypothetical protein